MGIKLFCKSPDGGKDSGVTGYFLIEWKNVFSIALLRFSKGSREAFHSHAFNAYTWWLKGAVEEQYLDGKKPKLWFPSIKPKFTPRDNFHKIIGLEESWCFTVRGPWSKTWQEHKEGETYTLTHGRVKVD